VEGKGTAYMKNRCERETFILGVYALFYFYLHILIVKIMDFIMTFFVCGTGV
jgi:hypothetical protein